MPGSGVNDKNLNELMQKTKAFEFHSSAKAFENSKMEYFNQNISMGGTESVNEFSKVTVNTAQIQKMANILNK